MAHSRMEELRRALDKQGYSMLETTSAGRPALELRWKGSEGPYQNDFVKLHTILDFYLDTWDWSEDEDHPDELVVLYYL